MLPPFYPPFSSFRLLVGISLRNSWAVVALGVVEHFTEEDMYRVLTHLLKVTTHRLILTVPYEQEPEAIYEHKQVFTPTKLRKLGEWCLQHINGAGRMWCEECVGGLLLIERLESRLLP
jgi:hypothetical protein